MGVINMESITKTKLTCKQIYIMTEVAFGKGTKPVIITELSDGYFNSAYFLSLSNGFKTILKVAPSKAITVMKYEKNIMETEVYVLNKIRSVGDVPVPKVLYYTGSGEKIKNQFFFMEYIEGVPLNKLHNKITETQYKKISLDLGTLVKKINSIEGIYFGNISQQDKRFQTWGETFLSMIKELLEDAADVKVQFPYAYHDIYNIVYEKRQVLNLVKKPALIHKDLWEGNIFVDPKTMKITGLIDCERAIYGDILLEPVCGFLLHNENFMKSYIGKVYLDTEEEVRSLLYQLYLYLIMVIECTYRKYSDENSSKWATSQLEGVLAELLKLS